MFPMVPYHALPELHKEMKQDCPEPSPSIAAALKEVFTALAKQRKDPTYTIVRKLPETARPYLYGPSPFGTVGPDWTPSQESTLITPESVGRNISAQ